MASWPASLPQNQFLGLVETDQDSVARTPMDSGPPTRRRRFAARVTNVSVPLILKGDDKQTFDTFFRTTINGGATAFNWEDPTDDSTVSFAFRSPPRWTLIRGGTSNTRVWSTTLELEIQP